MNVKRREFLMFLGAGAATIAFGACDKHQGQKLSMPFNQGNSGMSFKPIQLPIPLEIDDQPAAKQIVAYSNYEVLDDLVLPEGFTYDPIAAWGDLVGDDGRWGYNNDYLSFVETGPNRGYLTINFEYISGFTWMQTYSQAIGRSLPFQEVIAATQGPIDALALSDGNPLKAKISKICQECLIDQGIGVISLARNPDGKWTRTFSEADRRITGISGWQDGRYLRATGPAVAVFENRNKRGYEDGLGSRIIGTFANCAGGTTPWGTVLSAEENFQAQVPEPVFADGSSADPARNSFYIDNRFIAGQGNVFGLAGNKYGWMVEVDPANPNDYGTKHTWLGRFRHEAVAVRAVAGKRLAVYSGCDRRGGHLYKFLSKHHLSNPQDKANSKLMTEGMLYGAKFYADGTGRWIPLNPNTPVHPVLPSQVLGNNVILPNPDRRAGGIVKINNDAQAIAFGKQYQTLGDLYEGNYIEKQGAILIDAHYAANAAGITCTARPEDTDVAKDGTLYIAFTSGSPSSSGGPDKDIFIGPKNFDVFGMLRKNPSDIESPYEYGWIMRLTEDGLEPDAMTFRWEMLAMGGEPADGGLGFSNPDNLAIDRDGNIWMTTDIYTGGQNMPLPSRVKPDGSPVNQYEVLGVFGNNTTWFIPTSGPNAGLAYPFAIGPMETETCGPFFTPDQQTLFISLQHPGERNGQRQNGAAEVHKFAIRLPDGQEFIQERKVPIGSNWPGLGPKDPPKPAVVAIHRAVSPG